MRFNLLLSVFLFVLASFKPIPNEAQIPASTFTPSKNTTHKIKKDQAYTFGYLKVPENRQNPNTKMIEVPVYIFKSRSNHPQKDPIIYTVGGPGSSTMPSAQYMNYYQYLDDRDFILIEQRGTYYAKPHLACPEWAEAIHQSNLPGFDQSQYDALLEKAVQACKDRFVKRQIDLNGYNTNEITADINDLVEILEIESYNLLTISYSTKIAQVLMRDYPERIRSVVMDSPLPLEVSYEEESIQNLFACIDDLLSDCETDENCNQAYPDIKKRFSDYLIQKTQNPLVVEVENPKNGKIETFYLQGQDLVNVFTYASTSEIANVPLEINKLLNGDLSSVKEQLLGLFEKPGIGAGKGMRISVWCAEENPFNSPEKIALAERQFPQVKGVSATMFGDPICNIWGVKPVKAIENQPVKSTIPVLLISGSYDSDTPVKWAKAMQKNLSNSHHLIFKAWTHTPTTNWGDLCAMQAANDFFNDPSQKPNPECFKDIGKPKFTVNKE
ncbi:MAG: alpha/beta fold hydrolase [Bacteroidota bacterium]